MSRDDVTRVVQLNHDRKASNNRGTQVARELARPSLPHRVLFNLRQDALHLAVAAEPRPGLLIVAVSSHGEVAAKLWLAATHELRATTLGRHTGTELYVPGEGISLRHLIILVRAIDARIHYRVLDLRTDEGFLHEDGRCFRALSSDGPMVLGVGGYQLLFLPTGIGALWDREAKDPWTTLPPRLFVPDEAGGAPPVAYRPSVGDRRVNEAGIWGRGRGTNIVVQAPVVESSVLAKLLDGGEVPSGMLLIQAGLAEARVPIGPSALTRGVLLGRYDRCDSSDLLGSNSISRVHALLIRDGDQLFIADTGSTNGTLRADVAIRLEPLQSGVAYDLGGSAKLKWLSTGSV
jgi:hypothetical protein